MARIDQWNNKLAKLQDQREKNVNRYIAPLEIKIAELMGKIDDHIHNEILNKQ